jgi:hypothetical protein
MKKIKAGIISFLLSLLLLFSLASCENPSGGTPQIESFSILGDEYIEVELNGEHKLETNLSEADAAHITWSATNDKIMVTEDGCILGVRLGLSEVRAEIAGLRDSVQVRVVEESAPIGGEASPIHDPYKNVSAYAFYQNYKPATSYWDAYYRSLHSLMSGALETPDQAPQISSYQPMVNGKYLRNTEIYYSDNDLSYTVVDAYGDAVFTVYYGGAYITLEEVAAYVFAFGDVPANYTEGKDGDPSYSAWGKYLRLNHSYFSGSTSRYPYEPELPNISGCGGSLRYMEIDIGTTGTDCDPSYASRIYNDGSTITRGAARIVYGKSDLDGDGVLERGEQHVFYTYNHYNDFQEYLNYFGGWGEMFGNITGGGAISSKYNYNPTPYVDVYFGSLSQYENVASVVFILPEVYTKRFFAA